MRDFLDVKRRRMLDRKDLTVEMVATLHLLRPSRAINSGPNSAETLRYYSDTCSETRTLFVLLSCCISSFTKLVMSSLSRSTSSSLAPPLSSSHTSFFLFVFRFWLLYDRASIGRCKPSVLEVVARGDDPGGAVDRSDFLEIDWVDPKVTRITFAFTTKSSVTTCIDRRC